jgi:hypothetical protein
MTVKTNHEALTTILFHGKPGVLLRRLWLPEPLSEEWLHISFKVPVSLSRIIEIDSHTCIDEFTCVLLEMYVYLCVSAIRIVKPKNLHFNGDRSLFGVFDILVGRGFCQGKRRPTQFAWGLVPGPTRGLHMAVTMKTIDHLKDVETKLSG